jgi:hypothetical protein
VLTIHTVHHHTAAALGFKKSFPDLIILTPDVYAKQLRVLEQEQESSQKSGQ